jgi:tetratricopeptide (TPR) repeat protein
MPIAITTSSSMSVNARVRTIDGSLVTPDGISCAVESLGVKESMLFSGAISGRIRTGAVFISLWAAAVVVGAADIDLERTRGHFVKGDYDQCIAECEAALAERLRNEEWSLLMARSQMALGQYPEARTNLLDAIEQNSNSIRLRLLAYSVLRANGDLDGARAQLAQINELGGSRIWNYRDPANLVALGQAALLLGADPKLVLERFLDNARKADPLCRDAWTASGELALQKQDYALASTLYTDAARQFPEDPEFQLGLARAYASSDRPQAIQAIQSALDLNSRHVPSLVLFAELAIDSEDYAASDELLGKALEVNAWHPEAWACRAVLRELQDDPREAAQARSNALHFWDANPAVDHLIGRKLSQNYRFKEGAAHQRKALNFDPAFLPARLQLAQDLLRLGEDQEGWALAHEVQANDAYDVTAYNLATLHDTLAKFTTLTNDQFIVRMSPHEAELYGDRVLALLERARETLIAKYQVTLERPTTIEIFPEQKDFGVRTFGMPHNPGFLGVCFGPVVTANSPASQVPPSNWEAVLWHEFAHVITLQLTRNKMPRWLSEGLSVYEERLANPAWGQHMNATYREMILGGELTPVGKLSGAFLAPKTPMHIQFAYYQSSLVAEYLVEQFGWNTVLKILRDLGDGSTINDALAAHTVPLDQLEADFEKYARQLAQNLAPGLDWERPPGFTSRTDRGPARTRYSTPRPVPSSGEDEDKKEDDPYTRLMEERYGLHPGGAAENLESWTEDRLSTNYWALRRKVESSIAAARWSEALDPLQTLIREYPDQWGSDNVYALAATVHRGLGEPSAERAALARWAELDADALEAYQRLMTIDAEQADWESVVLNANRFLAVNPLISEPYQRLATAAEQLQRTDTAVAGWRKVIAAGAPDPTEAHFRLARLLHQQDDPAAKQHVLEALERAPRYRDAHRLLLELQPAKAANPSDSSDVDQSTTPPSP